MIPQTPPVRIPAQDSRAIVQAAGIRRRERQLVDGLLRRMKRLEAALQRRPGPGPQRDRPWRDIARLRREVARALALFARQPLLPGRRIQTGGRGVGA